MSTSLTSHFVRRRLSVFLPLLALCISAAFTASCGSGGSTSNATSPKFSGNTSVTLLATSTANGQLNQVTATFDNITLTDQSGKTVNLLAATPNFIEFIHLNGVAEPLATLSVPQGVYTSAAAMVPYATFTCISQLPGELQTSEFGPTGTPFATLTLPSPITITGTAMGLLLDLQVSKSITYSNCDEQGATSSIAPAFNLSPVILASQPTNLENGKVGGIDGLVASVSDSGNGFALVTSDGITSPLIANNSTVYQGISGFSSLLAGMAVDVDVAIQSDGSLLATRVGVDDSDTTNLTVMSGPSISLPVSQPWVEGFGRIGQGLLFGHQNVGVFNFGYNNATFQISAQFTNVAALPFPAAFNLANVFDGQNMYVSSHTPTFPSDYLPATTITLMPQTVNGAISSIGSDTGFATYTVSLAPYDLIPNLAVQPGQATVLTNPSSVVVYVDGNTQMLNTQPLAVGSVVRFNGLLFNDNGTARMDCGQVNDGVPE
jgi:hypothetical protein